MSEQKYVIVDPVTINGRLASPNNHDNFIVFTAGTEVIIVNELEDGLVDVLGETPWGSKMLQVIDRSSLREVE